MLKLGKLIVESILLLDFVIDLMHVCAEKKFSMVHYSATWLKDKKLFNDMYSIFSILVASE